MSDFTESAKGLARNPLGIIALFISFVYALACLVIGVSTSTLSSGERIPLIIFLIAFPVITLGCFMWLVIHHPTKLYAPSDYKEDINFMNTMGVSKLFQNLAQAPMDADHGNEDVIAKLLYSSITGLFLLYAVHLAKKHQISFTLSNLHSHCSVLDPGYSFGFFIANVSIGAISMIEEDQAITITAINETVDNNIKQRIYEAVSAHTDKTTLLGEIKNLEVAFGSLNKDEPEATKSSGSI